MYDFTVDEAPDIPANLVTKSVQNRPWNYVSLATAGNNRRSRKYYKAAIHRADRRKWRELLGVWREPRNMGRRFTGWHII